jgi:hypothetical protein
MEPIYFDAPSFSPLARQLAPYDLRAVVATVGGLLTAPEYHPQTLRIEVLLHLACLHCRGRKRPVLADLRNWLENLLGNHEIKHFEDPPEDVFVSNVVGPGGNYRLFEGTWATSRAYVQDIVTCLAQFPSAPEYAELMRSVLALLKLSDAIAERSSLERWAHSTATETRRFLGEPNLEELAARVTFSLSDLADLGIIALEEIEPFVLSDRDRGRIATEPWRRTSLERRPILRVADDVVVACPPAASVAIRRYTLEWMEKHGVLAQFESELRMVQHEAAFSALEQLIETDFTPPGMLPEIPPLAAALPVAIEDAVCAFDVDKRAHVVLVHDTLGSVLMRGLNSDLDLPDQGSDPFHVWLSNAAETLATGGVGGLTILVHAGLGRGLRMKTPAMPRDWHLVEFALPDFTAFAAAPDMGLLRLWKLYTQTAEVEEHGVTLQNMSGTLNLLEFWKGRGFSLVPEEFAYPQLHGFIALPTDSIQEFRVRELRRDDVHAARVDTSTKHTTVRRFMRDSFFQGLAMRPIYMAQGHAKLQKLTGVVEGSRSLVWVQTNRPSEAPEEVAAFLFNVWKGVLEWIDRAIPEIEVQIALRVHPPVHVHLTFCDAARWAEFSRTAGKIPAEPPIVSVNETSSEIALEIPFGFTAYLYRATNDGERLLLEALCEALLTVFADTDEQNADLARKETARSIVMAIMPGQHARALHLFDAPDPTDRITPGKRPTPRFVQPEDRAACRTGLGWRVIEQSGVDDGVTIGTREEATDALNRLVDIVWQDLKQRLTIINGPSLVQMALDNNEAAIRDRKWWRRTARALTALYEDSDDVARVDGERENGRALAIHAGRILVEMAVPTCPTEGGRNPSLSDFDSLLARVATIVDLAADSDAIHGGLAEGKIRIHPNGQVQANRSLIASVANPYAMQLHAVGFREAIESYDHLFRERARTESGDGQAAFAAPDFAAAFRAEYRIDPDQFLEATGEFVDLAIERGTLVTMTSRREISDRLCENRRFSTSDVDALLKFLALLPRNRWDATPQGFQMRDWLPWKYRRRLSLVARPIVLFGKQPDSPLLYGVNQLVLGTSFLLEGIENASLPNEFFASAEMQRYRGSVAEVRGHEFEETVAAALGELGWKTQVSVQMPSLGASAELGDVDVVAWHPEDPRLLLIECKRLQTARGVGEIVERLNQFRGDSTDRLGRHLRRVEWIQANFPAVTRSLHLPSAVIQVVPLLVVNADVPMQFQRDLPLPPEQILPLHRLAQQFVPGRH